MNIDIQKAKRVLDHLQAERQAQQHRLLLAAQAKRELDSTQHAVLLSGVEGLCQFASAKERYGLR